MSLVRHCWEGGTGVAGREVVALAAGRLLLSSTSVLPPHALEASAAVNALLKEASQVRRTCEAKAKLPGSIDERFVLIRSMVPLFPPFCFYSFLFSISSFFPLF